MKLDLTIETPISTSPRAHQLCSMYDFPPADISRREWKADLPIEDKDWSVGLIVGPSGSGKTQCARRLFGSENVDVPLEWGAAGVIDDFAAELPIKEIGDACSSVGFNTIPAWVRPYHVLSNGEKFRVDLARRLLELPAPVVVDEFSSVVDRQVAKIGSHAVQKFIRRTKRQFVAVSCHADIIDWLQPDWIFEPDTGRFHRRLLRRRPTVDVEVCRVGREAWRTFAPFHYIDTGVDCSKGSSAWGLYIGEKLVSIMLTRVRPISSRPGQPADLYGASRSVTLPDYQGIGLHFVLKETVASLHRAAGFRFRSYPGQPRLMRSLDSSPHWALIKRPERVVSKRRKLDPVRDWSSQGARTNAIFEYIGEAWPDADEARAMLAEKLPAEERGHAIKPSSSSRKRKSGRKLRIGNEGARIGSRRRSRK